MTVIECPTPNDGVELQDKGTGSSRFVRFDDGTCFTQEGLYILRSRFNQEFALIFADILAKKVES